MTRRFDEMVAWYQDLFEATTVHRDPVVAFLTYDDENHRFGFANLEILRPQPIDGAGIGESGVNHLSYTYASVGDLLGVYARLREQGIAPYWSVHHGVTLSLYYLDHGAKRRSAGYLAATLVNVTDAAAYRAAIAELNRAVGNPGAMRLVAFRSGNMAATHAVLIGGPDFKAVNEYLDKLYASDAYAKFSAKVGPTRKIVSVWMFQRVGTWGD